MAKAKVVEHDKKRMTFGIIMPIASTPEYPPNHWRNVLDILCGALYGTAFVPKLVSEDIALHYKKRKALDKNEPSKE